MTAKWVEQAQEWSLTVEEIDGSSYKGSGTRQFAEINVAGKDAHMAKDAEELPDIGDNMYDPVDDVTYTGIKLTSISYKRNHSACGNGLIATCSYSSEDAKKEQDDKKEEYGVWDGGLKAITIDASADWAWWTDDTVDGTAANLADTTKMQGRVSETLSWLIPSGSFTKRIYKLPGDPFDAWKDSFIAAVGKINNEEFEGFPIGHILLNSFSASRTLNDEGIDTWEIDIQFLWRVIPNKTFDAWQWIPVNKYVNDQSWSRPLMVLRSDGAGIQNGEHFLYYYADLSTVLS